MEKTLQNGQFAAVPHGKQLALNLDGGDLVRGGDVTLDPGELYVVPRGVEHCPRTEGGEVRAMLIEPAGTVNTGDLPAGERTAELDEGLL